MMLIVNWFHMYDSCKYILNTARIWYSKNQRNTQETTVVFIWVEARTPLDRTNQWWLSGHLEAWYIVYIPMHAWFNHTSFVVWGQKINKIYSVKFNMCLIVSCCGVKLHGMTSHACMIPSLVRKPKFTLVYIYTIHYSTNENEKVYNILAIFAHLLIDGKQYYLCQCWYQWALLVKGIKRENGEFKQFGSLFFVRCNYAASNLLDVTAW